MKGRKGRDAGGRVPDAEKTEHAGGNPYVFAEAKEKKKGGSAIHAAKAKHRLDRPGRKVGGRVGANSAPLSTAHKGVGGHSAD
jgi:hypothetical protein